MVTAPGGMPWATWARVAAGLGAGPALATLFSLPVHEETALNDLQADFAADDQERGLLRVAVAALAHADARCRVWGLGGLSDLVVNGRRMREAGDAASRCRRYSAVVMGAALPGPAAPGAPAGLALPVRAVAMAWALPAPLAFSSMPPKRLMPSQTARPAATMPPGMAQTLSGDLALDVVNVCALVPGLANPVARLVLLAKGFLGVAPGVL